MPTGQYDRKNIKVIPDPDYPLLETEKAYLAGIIDGEGSIMMIHHEPRKLSGHRCEYWVLRVLIANTNFKIIEWLLTRFGGGYSIGKSKNPKHADTYQWRVDSKRAYPILKAAYPYLLLKRQQAELAFEEISTHVYTGRRGHPPEMIEKRRKIGDAVKNLNKRGRKD